MRQRPSSIHGSIEASRPGMPWVPGGTFRMGSEDCYAEERPVHEVTVDGFWMDACAVTNEEFARFVDATGYVTVAERPVKPEDFSGAPPENLVPGSMVFWKREGPVDLHNYANWWAWTQGASWRRPIGPRSSLGGPEAAPRRSRRLRGRRSIRSVGGQGASHRARVGVRRSRRARRRELRVGRRGIPAGPGHGQHLAG